MPRKLALIFITCLAVPAVAHAAAVTSFGPRFGFSVTPDQLVLGGQMTIADVAPELSFVPNAELGFGDHQTDFSVNMDGHYRFAIQNSDWAPYVGFGLGIQFASFDRQAPALDGSDTSVGGNFILGADVPTHSGSKFFSELKLGLGDMPSLKIMAGWNFRSGR